MDVAEDTFAVTSASKAWSLDGRKASLVIAGVDVADVLARMPEGVSHGPAPFGVIAHAVALNQGEVWLDALLAGLSATRDP